MPEIRMNSLKSLGDELRSVVGDDPGPRIRLKFLDALQDDLDVRFGHRLPQVPVDDVSAAGPCHAPPESFASRSNRTGVQVRVAMLRQHKVIPHLVDQSHHYALSWS